MTAALILPASGRGERMGEDKLWADVAGRPLLAWTLDAVAAAQLDGPLVIAAPRQRWDALCELHGERAQELRLVEGGARRQDSVRAALTACPDAEWVVVHDAARPVAGASLFAAVLAAAGRDGAATTAIPVVDSVKRVAGGQVIATLDRAELVGVQTPQAFRRQLLSDAHARALAEGWLVDDDCALVERTGTCVRVVEGDPENLKVTRPHDLRLLRLLLGSAPGPA
ncbi:MAG: 2-C-methyl-D-erythritol 4-phosphate cytidylyltransferase [Candidatus Dormibacteria bacterium]